jgi:hypothetical protein
MAKGNQCFRLDRNDHEAGGFSGRHFVWVAKGARPV